MSSGSVSSDIGATGRSSVDMSDGPGKRGKAKGHSRAPGQNR
jgi:hypothetical protein